MSQPVRQPNSRAGVLRAGLIALALAVPLGAGAQAPSNPTLNAQLLVGARQGDLAQVERVLAAGASPSSRNRLGKTALLLAAEKGNLAIVEAMLKSGADVDQPSLEGVTPLMAASYAGAASGRQAPARRGREDRSGRSHEQAGDGLRRRARAAPPRSTRCSARASTSTRPTSIA